MSDKVDVRKITARKPSVPVCLAPGRPAFTLGVAWQGLPCVGGGGRGFRTKFREHVTVTRATESFFFLSFLAAGFNSAEVGGIHTLFT